MRIIDDLDVDPTRQEMENVPESQYEADANFYTPSQRYRNILKILDKDLTLSKLSKMDRREVTLMGRILLNAIKLEEVKRWKCRDGKLNREVSDYWIQRLALTVTETRAQDGFTAELSRSKISKTSETLDTKQQINDSRPGKLDRLLPKR